MMELDIYFYFEVKNMTSFTTALDILYKGKAVLLHYYAKIKVDSFDSLPLERR